MKPEIIKTIFSNVLFLIGVILLIVGFVTGSQTVAKLVSFSEYPLPSYEENRCEYEVMPVSAPVEPDGKPSTAPTTPSQEEVEARKQKCAEQVAKDRAVRKSDDIVRSSSMLFAGLVLAVIFRHAVRKDS